MVCSHRPKVHRPPDFDPPLRAGERFLQGHSVPERPGENADESRPESPVRLAQDWDDASMLSLVTDHEPGHNVYSGQSPTQRKGTFVTLGPMSATALSTRHPRGINPKGRKL